MPHWLVELVRWILFFAGVYAVTMGAAEIIKRRQRIKREAEDKARREEFAKNELKRKRDHQLNHGRQIYNWLVEELKEYRAFGIEVLRIEDNGGSYSIHIEDGKAGVPNLSIVQLSYDFVRYEDPYLGHIHYGAYGADIRIWVGSHSPKNGLDRLILREVREYVQRHSERLARSVPTPAMVGG